MAPKEREPLLNKDSRTPSDSTVSTVERRERNVIRVTPAMSKARIWKNLIALNFCIFIYLFGYQALCTLQSTMNIENGIGISTQATLYASATLSSIFLPKFAIKKFGCKLTMVIMLAVACPFITANIYPCWQTLIPTAIAAGMAAGPMSTSQFYYVNGLSLLYQSYVSDPIETIVAKFYGVTSFFVENTQIWGNLLSYYVLMPSTSMQPIATNTSCGIYFDRNITNGSNPNLDPPEVKKRYILVSIYAVFALMACILLALSVDTLEIKDSGESEESTCESIFAAIVHIKNPNQFLLLPLTIYVGLEVGFYSGDFTQAYIACLWGVYHVGYVTIAFGVSGAVMSIFVGHLVKCFGQTFLIVSAILVHTGIYFTLRYWDWYSSHVPQFFIIAALWGMADAVLWSQISAVYSMVFTKNTEAAFSNFYFWSYMGFFLSFAYANYLHITVKIYILFGFIFTGACGYLVVRYKLHQTHKNAYALLSGSFEHSESTSTNNISC